jgi:hypothetical protein
VQVVATGPRAAYRAAAGEALPNATIVADHFHLVRLANQMLTEVRQRAVRETHGHRGRATDPVWASRRRLLRGRATLSERAMSKLWAGLLDGDPTGLHPHRLDRERGAPRAARDGEARWDPLGPRAPAPAGSTPGALALPATPPRSSASPPP